MSVAYGHALYDPLPTNLFQIKWDWDPTLLFFAAMAILYIRGLKSFKRTKTIRPWQIGLFFTGVFVMILALIPPIDPLADRLFFMHMVQHIMMVSIGSPLILFGVPFYVIVRGAPVWFKRGVYLPAMRNRPLQAIFGFLGRPLPSLIFFQIMFWMWHAPVLYDLALFNDVIHLVEHGCFALSSMLLWRNIVAPKPINSPLPMPARLLFLAIIMASNIGLASWLTFTKKVWYGYEGIPQPGWWSWGYLQDQQLGGLIMWVPGGIIHFIAMTICFFVWVDSEQKKDQIQTAKLATAES
jgi:putative membrane protein